MYLINKVAIKIMIIVCYNLWIESIKRINYTDFIYCCIGVNSSKLTEQSYKKKKTIPLN